MTDKSFRGLSPTEAVEKAMGSDTATERLFRIHKELNDKGLSVMESKNHDYRGGTDDPYANFNGSKSLEIHPVVGMLLRMQDKMMRIKTFVEKGELQVKGEGVEDAILDIRNYAVLIAGWIEENARDQ
jgi:hypothetical protein